MPYAEPMDTSYVPIAIPIKRKRGSTRQRKTLRKLIAPRDVYRKPTGIVISHKNCACVRKVTKLVLVVVCIAAILSIYKHSESLRNELAEHYHQSFERLLFESNTLCSQRHVNFTPLLEAFDSKVVGQRHLRKDLIRWLENDDILLYDSAFFVGETGVGKSLTANIIAKHYPWQGNVYFVSVRLHTSDSKRYGAFKQVLFKILRASFLHDHCDRYMIVIDHLNVGDASLIGRINRRMQNVSDRQQLFLQALFVVRGTTNRLRESLVKEEMMHSQIFAFKPLKRIELEECIRREASTIGIDLSNNPSILQQVADQVNVSRYGCKPVRAKLNLYYLRNDNDGT